MTKLTRITRIFPGRLTRITRILLEVWMKKLTRITEFLLKDLRSDSTNSGWCETYKVDTNYANQNPNFTVFCNTRVTFQAAPLRRAKTLRGTDNANAHYTNGVKG